MKIKCSKCEGNVEAINRAGQRVFLFCRHCKLPHDEHGNPVYTTKSLAEHFNPLQAARDHISKVAPALKGPAKTALEAATIQRDLDIYFAGMKDGILLAYSQDFQEGEPMEKLGVERSELLSELRVKYNELKEKWASLDRGPLNKEACTSIDHELSVVQSKIDELTNDEL